jgi:hypothetical protein
MMRKNKKEKEKVRKILGRSDKIQNPTLIVYTWRQPLLSAGCQALLVT